MTSTIKGECHGRMSVCMGCTGIINDQYILRVSPDMEWHAACLKCADCHQFLDEFCTCFVREGKTYCKRDYLRLFGAKCDKCDGMFHRKDLVMRARTKIYHLDCFKCLACGKQLLPGDEFALRDDGLYCRLDFDSFEKKANQENNNTTNINHNEVKVETKPGRKERRESKTTRVRTVLNEKQLQTLRTCYSANCRPDALMKEQLVEMTGLSPRVIRVWFQNKRCKDKKRAILMKQMQQEKFGSFQEKQLALQGLTGVPMVASSPIRHDGAILNGGLNGPIDVRAYEPPWKNLSEFALSHDIDRIDTSTPGYQHLIQQMHGYGADLCSAVDILGPQTAPANHPPSSLTPQHSGHNSNVDSKFDMTPFDESVHSDSYVSYLESDDSMNAPLSGVRSP